MREFGWGRAALAAVMLTSMLFVMGCLPPVRVVGAVGVGSVASGNIVLPHTRQRFSLSLAYPQVVTVYVDGHAFDPTVRVINIGGAVMGYNDDGGIGTDAQLVLSLPPGNYYIEVAGFGPSTGAYTLTVR